MNMLNQNQALKDLEQFSALGKHSILIEGPVGSGKTHTAAMYSKMLGDYDFQIVEPTVKSLQAAMTSCIQIGTPIVLCVENLDKGVAAASYTLLKFLEEPPSNVYIVITCRNIKYIPNTIISRSVSTVISPPIDSDLIQYAQSKDLNRYNKLKESKLFRCARSFNDIETILRLSQEQIDYYNRLESVFKFKEPISAIVWKLGHYDDNSETPVELVVRYLMEISNNDSRINKIGISCLKDLNLGRIAKHAVLAKFVFDLEYTE